MPLSMYDVLVNTSREGLVSVDKSCSIILEKNIKYSQYIINPNRNRSTVAIRIWPLSWNLSQYWCLNQLAIPLGRKQLTVEKKQFSKIWFVCLAAYEQQSWTSKLLNNYIVRRKIHRRSLFRLECEAG